MKFSRKSKLMIIPAMLASFGALTFAPTTAFAWTDQTHMAIERTAGLRSYQNACAPDVSKTVSAINKLRKSDGQGPTARVTSMMRPRLRRARTSMRSSR